jgi:2-polyprenyl-3-methyl-5-hydroxy-6-metoxy-1,4-benzoquinol methylase
MDFLSTAQPGRALDLGCGTGTNAITMARFGWQVTAVDFSVRAIRTARRKAINASLSIDFRVGDVADLSSLAGRYDYALDIGCLFTLKTEARIRYAVGLSRLLKPGAQFMLYAWLRKPRGGGHWGMNPDEVTGLFTPSFELTRTEYGEEKWAGSAWYWLKKL